MFSPWKSKPNPACKRGTSCCSCHSLSVYTRLGNRIQRWIRKCRTVCTVDSNQRHWIIFPVKMLRLWNSVFIQCASEDRQSALEKYWYSYYLNTQRACASSACQPNSWFPALPITCLIGALQKSKELKGNNPLSDPFEVLLLRQSQTLPHDAAAYVSCGCFSTLDRSALISSEPNFPKCFNTIFFN